jgi:micrococcal nuclease
MYTYKAKLIRVIDGDTIEASVDLGFGLRYQMLIRLHGINTPETRTKDLKEKKAGMTAKKRLQEIMNDCDGIFTLKSHGIGKYGRCIGTLIIKNVDVNMLLLEEGHAEKYK